MPKHLAPGLYRPEEVAEAIMAEDHPTLEERVAALEAVMTPAVMVTRPEEWTPEQVAGFKKTWDEVKHQPPRLIPPKPLLTPELARELIRECVTVVKPGEVLVIRVPESWTAEQSGECMRYMNAWLEESAPGVKVMLVPGEELGVAGAAG